MEWQTTLQRTQSGKQLTCRFAAFCLQGSIDDDCQKAERSAIHSLIPACLSAHLDIVQIECRIGLLRSEWRRSLAAICGRISPLLAESAVSSAECCNSSYPLYSSTFVRYVQISQFMLVVQARSVNAALVGALSDENRIPRIS